ncbi:hypothetical protein Cgig2_027062 [Carnegiea gigantea]|uniref:Uncharacterized protein n=1 Tax=Carnegiea gigantea TaxID=171969 RepID=A0A9Q1K879_9CARY|nr:hypothetical protein Cgig2_027062 [Carnegiea gigantea]
MSLIYKSAHPFDFPDTKSALKSAFVVWLGERKSPLSTLTGTIPSDSSRRRRTPEPSKDVTNTGCVSTWCIHWYSDLSTLPSSVAGMIVPAIEVKLTHIRVVTTSRRLADRKSQKFQKNIVRRGSVPETTVKKGPDYPVGPVLLGFFIFVLSSRSSGQPPVEEWLKMHNMISSYSFNVFMFQSVDC